MGQCTTRRIRRIYVNFKRVVSSRKGGKWIRKWSSRGDPPFTVCALVYFNKKSEANIVQCKNVSNQVVCSQILVRLFSINVCFKHLTCFSRKIQIHHQSTQSSCVRSHKSHFKITGFSSVYTPRWTKLCVRKKDVFKHFMRPQTLIFYSFYKCFFLNTRLSFLLADLI